MLRNFLTPIDYKKLIELQANGTSYIITRDGKKNSKAQTQIIKQRQKKLKRHQ